MNRKQWDESDDPIPMVRHLAGRGCTLDFTCLVDLFLIRVWRKVSDPAFRQVLHEWFGAGPTELTQDQANAAAAARIKELQKQSRQLDQGSPEHRHIKHQIELGKSLLVFEGCGYEETITEVCRSMIAVSDDPARERRWQASTIRALFDFDYHAPPE